MVVRYVSAAAIVAACILLRPASASADTAYYRYDIETVAQAPATYAGKLSRADLPGRVFEVETDQRGRILRVTTFRDGAKINDLRYRYSRDSPLPDGYDGYVADELLTVVHYQRDAAGSIVRTDYYTAKNELTSYTVYQRADGRLAGTDYTPAGTLRSHWSEEFAPDGHRTRTVTYPTPNGGLFYDRSYDPSTGFLKRTVKYEDGKLALTNVTTRDENGDEVRQDLYNPDGNLYAVREFSRGLALRTLYTFRSGDRKELRYTHDEKRLVSRIDLSWNGKLACVLTFERRSDGTVTRTLASGPDGELWAEYVDAYVTDVYRDGSAVDEKPAHIFKTGDWW